MKSIYSIYNGMLAVWLVAVLIMGYALAVSIDDMGVGRLIEFIFTNGQSEVRLAPPPTPPELPSAPPAVEQPAPKAPEPPVEEWQAVAVGKGLGEGTLELVGTKVLENNSVEIEFRLNGKLGECRVFRPGNVTAYTIDFLGKMKATKSQDIRLQKGCISRVQIATHAQDSGFLRVSGIERDKVKVNVKAEYSPQKSLIRLTFFEVK